MELLTAKPVAPSPASVVDCPLYGTLPERVQQHLILQQPTIEEMEKERIAKILTVGASLAAIALAYHLSAEPNSIWRKLFQYLFFLPPVIAAFWFGWRGGILVAVLAALSYAPFPFQLTTDQVGESIDLLLIGSLLGYLADRERHKTELLRQTTAERTAAYEKLQQNVEHWKQAERLSAIGQLAAGLAHEIRTPLAAIEGASDLLRSDHLVPALREELVGILQKESKRLNRLLTELLDYARPRRPAFSPTDLGPVIDSVTRLVQVQAAKKELTLRSVVHPASAPVECDAEQIRQVLLNLCLNAVQAADQPGEILVESHTSPAGAIIEVSDQGPGVAAEIRDRLFEPFFTTKPDGTGLGLPVTRQIIEGHRGEIEVLANSPRGARFVIRIPLAQESLPV
jgi:signal transduction histidine kinase